MGDEERGTQGQGIPVGYAPEYMYGGQWFDDMSSLALAFPDAPIMAFDIGRTAMSREEINKITLALSQVKMYEGDTL